MTDTSTSPPSDPPLIPDGHLLDFSRTGIPWVDRVLDIAAVVVLVVMVVCAVGFIAWTRWIHPAISKLQDTAEKAAKDAAVTREHTENSHANAENPNLRDDMDAKHQEILSQNQQILANQEIQGRLIEEVARAQVRQDKELARIHEAQAADREDTRRVRATLEEHISGKRDYGPRLDSVERELKNHRRKTETP